MTKNGLPSKTLWIVTEIHLPFDHSVTLGQRTNVISCVTVHDSDSSTASPLTPHPRALNAAGTVSSRQAKSLAVVAPSVKIQAPERGATSRSRPETGEARPHS